MATPTQIRRRGRWSLILGTIFAFAALAAVAYADDISNNLDGSIDAVAEVMPLNVGGANGTTQLYLATTGGDGKPGCNLTGSTTLVLSVTSSNAAAATVSPSSVTFTSCGDTKTLTVTPVAQGSATINVSQIANSTGGTFNLDPATFTVNVVPPASANSAPQVFVAGVTGGESYNEGSVPEATCQVVDAEDGNSSFAATLSAITGTYASDGIGSQTASCSYTDGGGLTASASETYSIVDPSPPSVGYRLSPASPNGSNGWYTSDVNLTWDVSESDSPSSLQKAGCVDQNITADQAATSYSCAATSAGGSSGDPVSVSIKRDANAPQVSSTGYSSGTTGLDGWYTSAVANGFSASDSPSGLADCASTFTKSSGTAEGSSVAINSGSCSDNAGNKNSGIDTAPYKIDLSDPTVSSWTGSINDGASFYFGSVPAAPTCSAADAVSGPKSCDVTGHSTAVGQHTLTATAIDNAGRTDTALRSYTVLAWTPSGFFSPVDMGGVYNTVKAGSTVPLKFELFAGPTELTDVTSVKSVTAAKVACLGGLTEDAIEEVAPVTGGTALRYDANAGQFIYNWKTAGKAADCLRVTMLAQDEVTKIQALFKLK